VVAALIAVVVVTVVHLATPGSGGGCGISPPVPSLPPALSALGGFDQPYDPSNVRTLDGVATQAAGAVKPNLIGTDAGPAVDETPLDPSRPAALVIPLRYARSSSNAGRIAGLVAFLRDCTGRVYFSAVRDLTALATAPATFPSVSAASAASRLATTDPLLSYSDDPFQPVWRNTQTGATIPAAQ
jgi:hypothetical protein